MSNEAAERLRYPDARLNDAEKRELLDEALDVERGATVERVKVNLEKVAALASGDVEALDRIFSRGHYETDYADYLSGYATALLDMARREKPLDAGASS
jgi:hypothetical protein